MKKEDSLKPAKVWNTIKYPYDRVISLIYNYVKHFKGKSLDIGCSGGAHLKILDQLGFESYGIEPHDESYKICITNHNHLKDNIYNTTLEQFINQTKIDFNVIICWGISPLGIIDNFSLLMSQLNSNIIICNYRTKDNSILKRPCNIYNKDNTILIRDKQHHNYGMLYRSHTLNELDIPNYTLIHIQTHSHYINKSYIKRFKPEDKDEWYECVYFKTSLLSGLSPELLFSYNKDEFTININNIESYFNKYKNETNDIILSELDNSISLIPMDINNIPVCISFYVVWGKVVDILFKNNKYDENGLPLKSSSICLPDNHKLLQRTAENIAIKNNINVVRIDLLSINNHIEYRFLKNYLPNKIYYDKILAGYLFREKYVK